MVYNDMPFEKEPNLFSYTFNNAMIVLRSNDRRLFHYAMNVLKEEKYKWTI
jgi:hypothetical protein